jgi:hypothetical protein
MKRGTRHEHAPATSGQYGVVDRNLYRYSIRLKTDGWLREFGVTAYTETDALEILRYVAFAPAGLPEVIEIVADVTSGRLTRACRPQHEPAELARHLVPEGLRHRASSVAR